MRYICFCTISRIVCCSAHSQWITRKAQKREGINGVQSFGSTFWLQLFIALEHGPLTKRHGHTTNFMQGEDQVHHIWNLALAIIWEFNVERRSVATRILMKQWSVLCSLHNQSSRHAPCAWPQGGYDLVQNVELVWFSETHFMDIGIVLSRAFLKILGIAPLNDSKYDRSHAPFSWRLVPLEILFSGNSILQNAPLKKRLS